MKVIKFVSSIDKIIEKVSAVSLVIAVGLMLLLTLINIVGRWVNIPIMWIDPAVRHLVFLSTFLGGVIATGRGTHVGIDIITKYLENKKLDHLKQVVQQFINAVALITLIWLVYASYLFFKVELQYGKAHFLGIHSAALVFIIPFGFGLIAYRFFNRFLVGFISEGETC